MKLYRTKQGALVEEHGRCYRLNVKSWDTLINRDDLFQSLAGLIKRRRALGRNFQLKDSGPMAPIGSQEVWAAGVTYYRSREARIDESKEGGVVISIAEFIWLNVPNSFSRPRLIGSSAMDSTFESERTRAGTFRNRNWLFW